MTKQTQLFKQYENLINQRAWFYAAKYNHDFDDLQSRAFELFVEAFHRYDKTKAQFGTFLYHRLFRLNDYCKREKRIQYRQYFHYSHTTRRVVNDELNYDEGSMIDSFPDERIWKSILNEELCLSEDAYQLLSGLIYGEFYDCERNVGRKLPGKNTVIKRWGWIRPRVDKAWDELTLWWRSYRYERSFV